MKIIKVPINELSPSEYNPRQASEKQYNDLKESIIRFGLVDPIIVNSAENRKNVIIGGHFRYKVAKDLGYKEIPVVYVDLPDIEKEKELNLRLNKNLAEWDWDLLANFNEEVLLDVGFDINELDNIIQPKIDEEYDVAKELSEILQKKEKRVKDGDLWQLGEHKLIIGDCTDRKNWERLLKDERFDFMFTDPPYKLGWLKSGKGFGYKKQRKYEGTLKMGRFPEYDEWLSIANEFQNPEGANVMIFENWRNTIELWQAIEKYWKIKNVVIWHKTNKHYSYSRKRAFFNKYEIIPLSGEGKLNEEYEKELDDYLKEKGQKLLDTYEIIIYGQQRNSEWKKIKGSKWIRVNDHISSVVDSSYTSPREIAGTKPIQILVPYIKILSPREGIVMEPFGGSGSTLIACEIMKRKCRTIEIEPLYAEVIINRWEKFTNQKAKKL